MGVLPHHSTTLPINLMSAKLLGASNPANPLLPTTKKPASSKVLCPSMCARYDDSSNTIVITSLHI